MAKKDAAGRWQNSKGEWIPEKYIDVVDRSRDKKVESLYKKAIKLEKELREFKSLAFSEIEKHIKLVEEKYEMNASSKGGNKTLLSFNGNKKVEIIVSNRIEFDERLSLAKDLIDNCIKKWSEGANNNIIVLIAQAFQVDKKGKLDRDRILGLKNLKISDNEWNKAMEIISDSMQIVGSKKYIKFSIRDEDGGWETVKLDISQV